MFFPRAQLKQDAKQRLQGRYWDAVVAMLAYLGITTVVGFMPTIPTALMSNSRIALTVMPFLSIVSIGLIIFIVIPLSVGMILYFMRLSKFDGRISVSTLFEPFRFLMRAVGAMLWSGLWVFIWMLPYMVVAVGLAINIAQSAYMGTYQQTSVWILFLSTPLMIPGIIKAYSYSLTPYIIAENPYIPARRALKMSIAMTRGYKGSLFLLQLSFIGWGLLAGIPVALLNLTPLAPLSSFVMIFLYPYIYTSFANAYLFIRQQALVSGALSEADFTPPPSPGAY